MRKFCHEDIIADARRSALAKEEEAKKAGKTTAHKKTPETIQAVIEHTAFGTSLDGLAHLAGLTVDALKEIYAYEIANADKWINNFIVAKYYSVIRETDLKTAAHACEFWMTHHPEMRKIWKKDPAEFDIKADFNYPGRDEMLTNFVTMMDRKQDTIQ